jgi:hypothetical protein
MEVQQIPKHRTEMKIMKQGPWDNLGGGSADRGTTCTQGRRSRIEKTIENSRTKTYGDHFRGRVVTNVATRSGTTK